MTTTARDSLLDALADRAPTTAEGLEDRPAAPETSTTALRVDQWGLHRGEQLTGADWNEATQHDAATLADCHAAAFEPVPELAPNCADAHRAQWFRDLLDSPEYRQLHNVTQFDDALSELAAKHLADQYAAYAEEHSDDEQPQDGQGPGEDGEPIKDQIGRMRSIQKATTEAREEVKDAQDMAAGLGMGEPGSPLDREALAAAFRATRDNKTLHAILAAAGRFRCLARAKQRQKTRHGQDDVVGVELGGDLARLLPAELAALEIEEMELDTLRRIAERQALCREHHGTEHVAQGPIVVVVDESGSMRSREKIIKAKAVALAMGWIAQSQRRWIAFVGFAGGTEGTRVAFPPGRWDQPKLIEWLTHFYGGGTTLDVPLDALPNKYWAEFGAPRGKTDVVIITDAIVDCPAETARKFNEWRTKEKAKVYSLILGAEAGDLAAVSDRTWSVADLDTETPAIAEIFSV